MVRPYMHPATPRGVRRTRRHGPRVPTRPRFPSGSASAGHSRSRRPPTRLPDNRLRNSFQLQFAGRGERVVGAPRHEGDEFGRENAAALVRGAQTCRLHDRVTEGIAVILHCVSRGDAHAEPEVFPSGHVVSGHRSLHRDGTVEGSPEAREGAHQPVAEVLHLRAPVAHRRSSQQAEVGLPEGLRLVGGEAVRERGGTHEVGEHDEDADRSVHTDVVRAMECRPFPRLPP